MSATFEEMEKLKQASEDIHRRQSSSSSSFTSEVSQDPFQDNELEGTVNQINNETCDIKAEQVLQTDDLLELGAEGNHLTYTINYFL